MRQLERVSRPRQVERVSRPRQATKESDPAIACQSANPTRHYDKRSLRRLQELAARLGVCTVC
jgi:hypothetical protein